MIYSSPSISFEAVVEGFATGLVGTVGVRVRDNQGTDAIARTTAGIAEDIAGSGIYRVTLTAPTVGGQYTVVWDTGGATPRYATEELTVTASVFPSGLGVDNAYITTAALKNTLNLAGETFADPDVSAAVVSASRLIDSFCGRRFYPDADANQVRIYSPCDTEDVEIDDLITLTSLLTDEDYDGTFERTWTQGLDFSLEPTNPELIDATNRQPWTRIRRRFRGRYLFPILDTRSVQVTGKFGWPVIPPAVVEACTLLSHRLLRRARDAPFAMIALGVDQPGAALPKTDPDVAQLLSPLVRGYGIG